VLAEFGTPALRRAALDENGERGALHTVARLARAFDDLDAELREQLLARPTTGPSFSDTRVGALEPLLDHLRGDQAFVIELEEHTALMAPLFDPRVFDATVAAVFPGLLVCSPESRALFYAVLQQLLPHTRPWLAGWAAPMLLIPLLEGAYHGRVDGWPRNRFRRHIQHTDSSEIPFSDPLRVLALVESKGVVGPRTRRPAGEPTLTGAPRDPTRGAQPRRQRPALPVTRQETLREETPSRPDGTEPDRSGTAPTTDDVARILGI